MVSRFLPCSVSRTVAAVPDRPDWLMRSAVRLRRVTRLRARPAARTLEESSRSVASRTQWDPVPYAPAAWRRAPAQRRPRSATETGYVGAHVECLGTTLTDSGTTDRTVAFFHVPVTAHVAEMPESHEAIYRTVLLTRAELWSRIFSGTARDAFTVQALALYEARLSSGYGRGASPEDLPRNDANS